MQYRYDASRGAAYARLYANYFELSEDLRLFFYDRSGSDCTNFCCQCVWAAYGGWMPGFSEKIIEENRELIKKAVRMVPFTWYGSLFFSGSNKWCRVIEFWDFMLAPKTYGPNGIRIFEGDWSGLRPSLIHTGDVIQLVVKSYIPYRYGHCLYVTESGSTFDDIKICCHSYDRLDAPLSEFSSFPDEYTGVRVMRLRAADFIR